MLNACVKGTNVPFFWVPNRSNSIDGIDWAGPCSMELYRAYAPKTNQRKYLKGKEDFFFAKKHRSIHNPEVK
jgi:hypothetical protein